MPFKLNEHYSMHTLIYSLFLAKNKNYYCNFYNRCEIAAGQPIDTEDGINTSNFYIELGTAQV